MKDEYQTFKKLKFVESGLGWNETTKVIEATEIWWLQKIQENPKFKKFKNRNLSLFMTYYDTLFGDVVATGDRARTANMYSAVNLETGEQFTEEAADDGKEGSGDSEENNFSIKNWFEYKSLNLCIKEYKFYWICNCKVLEMLKPELNFPHPTENKYYLVDAGYAHKKGYMAPYKGSGIRYHIQDFRRANGTARLPRNTKERFNHLHSSCRMVIERTFGVWKARFCILANMPMYKINTQTDIVLATMMIHNYIRKSRITDNAFETAEQENYIPENATSTPNPSQGASGREGNQDRAWSAKRDEIAANIP
ncbi:hypothetical protein DCAR_0934374 [Daucus carota subsp. sativus]|uniref:DDE Tnp4 domain-containing protein n=1 Tax=Daucus carota subsp. sativus TaxID=79200 RepID=A0AAF0XV47_DAUCS|nr:hypothetical protein DCAR_0934374 [Daucus carota subsp. sativus]